MLVSYKVLNHFHAVLELVLAVAADTGVWNSDYFTFRGRHHARRKTQNRSDLLSYAAHRPHHGGSRDEFLVRRGIQNRGRISELRDPSGSHGPFWPGEVRDRAGNEGKIGGYRSRRPISHDLFPARARRRRLHHRRLEKPGT